MATTSRKRLTHSLLYKMTQYLISYLNFYNASVSSHFLVLNYYETFVYFLEHFIKLRRHLTIIKKLIIKNSD